MGSRRDFACTACPIVGMKNGHQVIYFDGMTQFFGSGSDFNLFTKGLSALILIAPSSSSTQYDSVLEFNDSLSDQSRVSVGHGLGPQFDYGVCDATVCPYATSTSWTAGWQCSAVVQAQDGKVSMFLNGSPLMVGYGQGTAMSVPVPQDVPRTHDKIGFGNTGNGYYNGAIAEIIVYNAPISSSSIAALQSYLNRRWAYSQ